MSYTQPSFGEPAKIEQWTERSVLERIDWIMTFYSVLYIGINLTKSRLSSKLNNNQDIVTVDRFFFVINIYALYTRKLVKI